MPIEKRFFLQNNITELNTLAAAIETFAEQADIGMKAQFNLNLALDELLTNIVSYAYDDNGLHQIEITLNYEEPMLSATLVDDGKAFDPTQVDKPELDADVEKRKIGGLGIHFVHAFMDKVEYCRIDSYNQLLLEKDLSSL